MPTRIVHNAKTGEITEVEMTAEEVAQLEADRAALRLKLEKKAEAEVARQALLDRLGITADEARLLIG